MNTNCSLFAIHRLTTYVASGHSWPSHTHSTHSAYVPISYDLALLVRGSYRMPALVVTLGKAVVRTYILWPGTSHTGFISYGQPSRAPTYGQRTYLYPMSWHSPYEIPIVQPKWSCPYVRPHQDLPAGPCRAQESRPHLVSIGATGTGSICHHPTEFGCRKKENS